MVPNVVSHLFSPQYKQSLAMCPSRSVIMNIPFHRPDVPQPPLLSPSLFYIPLIVIPTLSHTSHSIMSRSPSVCPNILNNSLYFHNTFLPFPFISLHSFHFAVSLTFSLLCSIFKPVVTNNTYLP